MSTVTDIILKYDEEDNEAFDAISDFLKISYRRTESTCDVLVPVDIPSGNRVFGSSLAFAAINYLEIDEFVKFLGEIKYMDPSEWQLFTVNEYDFRMREISVKGWEDND
jgi:hypothetical protein